MYGQIPDCFLDSFLDDLRLFLWNLENVLDGRSQHPDHPRAKPSEYMALRVRLASQQLDHFRRGKYCDLLRLPR